MKVFQSTAYGSLQALMMIGILRMVIQLYKGILFDLGEDDGNYNPDNEKFSSIILMGINNIILIMKIEKS